MIAKTQPTVDQFLMKENLRSLLKKRSLIRRPKDGKESKTAKEARELLDAEIQNAQNYLQTNVGNMPFMQKVKEKVNPKFDSPNA